jgi:hypothetical protein
MYTVLNPHLSDFFATPLSFLIFKRRSLKKYEYIIKNDQLKPGELSFLFDNLSSSLIPDKYFSLLPYFLKKIIVKAEIKKWKKVNAIGDNIKLHFNIKEIPSTNVLFFLCYRNYKNKNSLEKIAAHFKHSIAHLTHYYAFPVEYSAAISNIKNISIAADAAVSENTFFKKYFGWYKKEVLFIPFAIGERFTIKKSFGERENKAIATGTFHVLENDVAANDANCFEIKQISNSIHPMRRLLYQHKDSISDYTDVFCKPFYEKNNVTLAEKSNKVSSKMQASQSAYFSFDIVEKYNQFKFAVIGEESINGLPGIGSFEAMACGCVLIANTDCYKGTGAKEGVHFLKYNNDIDSLITTIKENINNAGLEQISKNASEFVNNSMRPGILQQRFYNTIKNL